jgi:hypothetical protein
MANKALDKIYSLIQDRVKSGYAYKGTKAYNVSMSDLKKMKNIADKYGFPVEWLANLINHESAGTWNPSITNSIGATGLIQFVPKTAKSLGTTTDKLRSMNFSKQLDYVDSYLFEALENKRLMDENGKVPNSFAQSDLFMLIFYPKSVGQPNYIFPDSVQQANGVSTPKQYTEKVLKNAFFDLSEAPFTLKEYLDKYKTLTPSFASGQKKWWVLPTFIIIFGSTIVFSIWYLKKRKAI